MRHKQNFAPLASINQILRR